MIKAIFFDCFGVFYVDPFKNFIQSAPQEIQPELNDIMLQDDLGKVSQKEIVQRYAKLTNRSENEVYDLLYKSEMVLNVRLMDYAQKLRPKYKLGMISNLRPQALDNYFTRDQQRQLFDSIIVSGDVGFIKPDPRIYEVACQKLDVAPTEAVMIDDRQENCDGAARVGMKTILYNDIASCEKQLNEILHQNA